MAAEARSEQLTDAAAGQIHGRQPSHLSQRSELHQFTDPGDGSSWADCGGNEMHQYIHSHAAQLDVT